MKPLILILMLASILHAQAVPPEFQELAHKSAENVGGQTQKELRARWDAQQDTSNHFFRWDTWTFLTFSDTTKVYRVIFGEDTLYENTGKVWTLAVMAPILRLYSRYEKDCYVDSTLTNGAVFRPWNGGAEFWVSNYRKDPDAMDINFIRWEQHWLHRQPSFFGFIEWLRRQCNGS